MNEPSDAPIISASASLSGFKTERLVSSARIT